MADNFESSSSDEASSNEFDDELKLRPDSGIEADYFHYNDDYQGAGVVSDEPAFQGRTTDNANSLNNCPTTASNHHRHQYDNYHNNIESKKIDDPLSEPIVRLSLQKIQISSIQLINMSVKELNRLLSSFPTDIVTKLKRCRRTLKNRGYAKNCRIKRVAAKTQLEQVNMKLAAENRELRQRNRMLMEQFNQIKSLEIASSSSNQSETNGMASDSGSDVASRFAGVVDDHQCQSQHSLAKIEHHHHQQQQPSTINNNNQVMNGYEPNHEQQQQQQQQQQQYSNNLAYTSASNGGVMFYPHLVEADLDYLVEDIASPFPYNEWQAPAASSSFTSSSSPMNRRTNLI